ncbi:MAG: DNA polymerase I [Zetaproteobacteria bacterium]|nr:MAG: DNA polymerase I [Zetaproteobacteria bacterium]
MPHLVLIDGPNYVFRAFHAIRHNLSNAKGEPTNAIFGYVQMLRSVLNELSPTHLAVAFDPRDGTFRNRLYPDYKAHRPPMPPELAVQWPRIFELTDAFRCNRLQVDDFEADDIIATLTRQARARGWDVTIVSTDKDLMQLVDDHVRLLDTMRNTSYGPAEVREKWGVPPERVHDLLALTGDSSDNIPGVPGIGPKTAAQLLAQYGDLEGVLRHAPEIRQRKRRENLVEHADDARLSYRLVALHDEVPLPCTLDDLAAREPDRTRLGALFQELEFRRLAREFADAPSAPPTSTPARQDQRVDNEGALAAMIAHLRDAELLAIDTETTSLNTRDAKLVGLALATSAERAWYIPLAHQEPNAPQLSWERVRAALKPILEDASLPKCGHNLKYDLQVLRRAGIELAGIRFDSMLLAYCLHPGKYPPSLDNVAQDHLGHRCISYEQVVGKGAKKLSFAQVPIERALPYACEDAAIAWQLSRKLSALLAEQQRLKRHDDIELPLMHVLADMEWRGAGIDPDMLARLSHAFGARLRELEQAIHRAAGETFNIHSPRQLGVLLFEKLALPGGKKTKSGQWSTTQDVLETLAEEHEVPRLILQARALSKLKSTYTDALRRLAHPDTKRVHTSYNQAITTTGRLSSSDPNLQNIPVRSAEGREIRKAFVAPPGFVLLAADYSQIELRLMAHFSRDAALLRAFAQGEDIHAATAAAIHGVPLEAVSGEMRREAKIINFGILYGMGPFGLSKQLGISRAEARAFIDAYFARHPDVRAFLDQTLAHAREHGHVETLLGHRVPIPDIHARNGMRRQYAERTAINAPLQGSAADIIKVAMIRLHRELRARWPEAHMILQVHDELVVECPASEAEQVAAAMRRIMEQAVQLRVPLVVDIGQGRNWYEAHRL